MDGVRTWEGGAAAFAHIAKSFFCNTHSVAKPTSVFNARCLCQVRLAEEEARRAEEEAHRLQKQAHTPTAVVARWWFGNRMALPVGEYEAQAHV